MPMISNSSIIYSTITTKIDVYVTKKTRDTFPASKQKSSLLVLKQHWTTKNNYNLYIKALLSAKKERTSDLDRNYFNNLQPIPLLQLKTVAKAAQRLLRWPKTMIMMKP
jgi:hypothetical protein